MLVQGSHHRVRRCSPGVTEIPKLDGLPPSAKAPTPGLQRPVPGLPARSLPPPRPTFPRNFGTHLQPLDTVLPTVPAVALPVPRPVAHFAQFRGGSAGSGCMTATSIPSPGHSAACRPMRCLVRVVSRRNQRIHPQHVLRKHWVSFPPSCWNPRYEMHPYAVLGLEFSARTDTTKARSMPNET